MSFFLQQKMPFSRGLGKEVLFICISGCSALLLFFLTRPFGFSNLNNSALLGYGVVSIASALFYVSVSHFLYNKYWKNREWTIGWEISYSLLFLVLVALAILFYGNAIHVTELSLRNTIIYLSCTVLFGIIPVIIRAILVRNWRLGNELREVARINELLSNRKMIDAEKIIEFPLTKKDSLKLTNLELLYLESAENYVNIFWRERNETRKTMVRMTMKDAIKLIDDRFIVQCHRSYLVNLRKVKQFASVEGNSVLILQDTPSQIPISETYKETIKKQLRHV